MAIDLGLRPETLRVNLTPGQVFTATLRRYDRPAADPERQPASWDIPPVLRTATGDWPSSISGSAATWDVPAAQVDALIATRQTRAEMLVNGVTWAQGDWVSTRNRDSRAPLSVGGSSWLDASEAPAYVTTGQPAALEPIPTRLQRVLAELVTPARGVHLLRTGDSYAAYLPARHGWLRYGLPRVTGSGTDGPFGAGGVNMLREVDHVEALTGVDYALAGAVETGTGWGTSTSAPWSWRRSETPGDTTTWTSPTATALGITVARHPTGGGIAAVAIDGDAYAATGLPTAQNLVDDGRMDPTQLTTGGGTVDPLARCYHSYATAATGDIRLLLAAGLAAGPHTVQVRPVGWRPGAVAGQRRVNVQGFAHATAQPATPAGPVWVGERLSDVNGSAWEVATSYAPEGGTTTFLGTFHGNHVQSSVTVEVDGSDTVPADGTLVSATRSVRVTTSGQLVHPTGGPSADVDISYVWDVEGLTISPRVAWLQPGRVTAAYAMMAVTGPRRHGGFQFGTTEGSASPPAAVPTTVPLDVDLNVSKAAGAWVWSGRWTAVHLVRDWGAWTAGGADERTTVIEARNTSLGTSLVKVYNPRTKSTEGEGVVPGTVHEYTALVVFANQRTDVGLL